MTLEHQQRLIMFLLVQADKNSYQIPNRFETKQFFYKWDIETI